MWNVCNQLWYKWHRSYKQTKHFIVAQMIQTDFDTGTWYEHVHPKIHKSTENNENVWNLVFFPRKCVTINHTYSAEILMRFCEVCVENGLNFATTIGSSIMTRLQFTGCCQSFYGGEGGPHWTRTPLLFSNFLPVTFWLSPKLKSTCGGWRFLGIRLQ
jgi:hypothetical protein